MEIARPENPKFNLAHSWLWTPGRERKGCHCLISLSVFYMYLCMYFTLTNPFHLPAIYLNGDTCCSAGDYIIYIYIRIFLPSTLHYLCTYTSQHCTNYKSALEEINSTSTSRSNPSHSSICHCLHRRHNVRQGDKQLQCHYQNSS